MTPRRQRMILVGLFVAGVAVAVGTDSLASVDDLKKNLNSKVDGKNIKVGLKLSGDAIGKAVGSDE